MDRIHIRQVFRAEFLVEKVSVVKGVVVEGMGEPVGFLSNIMVLNTSEVHMGSRVDQGNVFRSSLTVGGTLSTASEEAHEEVGSLGTALRYETTVHKIKRSLESAY